MSGEDHHGHIGIGLFDLVQKVESRTIGKFQVDDRHIRHELGYGGPASLDGVGHLDLVAPLLNDVGHARACRAIVVNNQDSLH